MRTVRRTAALIVTGAVLAAGAGAGAGPAAAAPPGYWTSCSDPAPSKGAYAFKHHNASCATARRLARAFSTDNSTPSGWDCNYWKKRGYNLYRCTKAPGNAVWAVTWRRVALVH